MLAIGDGLPSRACTLVNAHALARYAALCQEAQIVPIVEPEVLIDGAHTLARCAEVTAQVLHQVFEQLHLQGVALEGMLLKPNTMLPGLACAEPASLDEVADATLSCLLRASPAAVAGGQSATLATARLNAMHQGTGALDSASALRRPTLPLPWPLSFSFGRAPQQPALGLWRRRPEPGRRAARIAAPCALQCRGDAGAPGIR